MRGRTFGETVLRKLRVHAHHVDRSCEEGAQHRIRDDLPPILGILQIVLPNVCPYLFDYLQQPQHIATVREHEAEAVWTSQKVEVLLAATGTCGTLFCCLAPQPATLDGLTSTLKTHQPGRQRVLFRTPSRCWKA